MADNAFFVRAGFEASGLVPVTERYTPLQICPATCAANFCGVIEGGCGGSRCCGSAQTCCR